MNLILFTYLKENIRATIGVAFEIIPIINSGGRIGICEAYNIGARRSKFGMLCFMHEDVRMHTMSWGKIVSRILQDKSIGLLGVAGSIFFRFRTHLNQYF